MARPKMLIKNNNYNLYKIAKVFYFILQLFINQPFNIY